MRYQGRLSDWKDDKGFGFVTPHGGGQRAFVHIKSFSKRQRRPLGNEIVTYEVVFDGMGRAQAENIAFVGEQRTPSAGARRGAPLLTGGLFFMFALFVAVVVGAGKAPLALPLVYLGASVITFIAYLIDKSAAQAKRWRTPESTLHLCALACGWPGALAAQYLLRHKSKKASFLRAFWFTVAVNFGALCWLLFAQHAAGLRAMLGAELFG